MAPDLGADSTRLTASGHSSVAHLASYLAATSPQENASPDLPALKGLLLVSGIYDLTDIPDSFLKYEAKMTPAEASAWSPLTSRHLDGPRRIIMLGEMDTAPFHVQRSEEHTSELQSLMRISYAVFCLKKKKIYTPIN